MQSPGESISTLIAKRDIKSIQAILKNNPSQAQYEEAHNAFLKAALNADEQFVYALAQCGLRFGQQEFVQLWATLTKTPQTAHAKATFELISLLNGSGIYDFLKDPTGYIQQEMAREQLTIAYSELGRRVTQYGYKLAKNGLRYLWNWSAQKTPVTDARYQTKVNKRNTYNQTMLTFAALFGLKQQLSNLIKLNAHVNARDWKKRTPIFYAARYGHYQCVKKLIRKGAYIYIRDEDGLRPLDHAQAYNHTAIVFRLILAHKAREVRRFGENNSHPLCNSWNLNILQQLADNGYFN